MWFRNLLVYRFAPVPGISAELLHEKLSHDALQPCGSFEMESRGWVSPRGDDRHVYSLERQWLIALGVNQKLLPASVVNQVAKERADALAAQQDRPPGRRQLREIRERVLAELMPKALSRRRALRAWVDPVQGMLAVDTAAEKKAEELVQALRNATPEISVARFETQRSPASAMTQWLSSAEPPEGFTIDQDLELRAADAGKGVVRYVRHPLEGREIRDHITAGKTATRLGLTWKNRISFVLTEQLQVKRLVFLDVLRADSEGRAQDADEQFDIDFALMTGELSRLLADLAQALGGEKPRAT